MDGLLHTLLGLAILASTVAAFFLLGPVMAAGTVASWDIYFREVTQEQAKHFDFNFRKGWNPAKWSKAKNLETWIPVCLVFGVAAAIEIGAQ